MKKNLTRYVVMILSLVCVMLAPALAAAENSYPAYILSSTARTAAGTTTCSGGSAGQYCSADQTNSDWKGVRLFLNTTAETGTSSGTCKVQNYDYTSLTYQDVPGAAFAAIDDTSSDDVNLTVYPGVAETANVSVSDVLGRRWRVHCAITGTSLTFSIGAHLLE